MMTFYAAAGSYQIRSEDGKNMPYIMRQGKLQPVSIPEFSLWSMLLWDMVNLSPFILIFIILWPTTAVEIRIF